MRATDAGNPDPDRTLAHHAAHITTLHKAGVAVTELAPLTSFADAQFVQDTALCLPQSAVMMRPGAPAIDAAR